MSTCGTCRRVFADGWQSRQQHMDATGHFPPDFECETCDRYFSSQKAVDQHMTDVCHWAESSESDEQEYECDDCDDTFSDENDLREHEVNEHFYCDPCDRYFQDRNSIYQVWEISPAHITVLTLANIIFISIYIARFIVTVQFGAFSAKSSVEQLQVWSTTLKAAPAPRHL